MPSLKNFPQKKLFFANIYHFRLFPMKFETLLKPPSVQAVLRIHISWTFALFFPAYIGLRIYRKASLSVAFLF